jgi:hypothetical protein
MANFTAMHGKTKVKKTHPLLFRKLKRGAGREGGSFAVEGGRWRRLRLMFIYCYNARKKKDEEKRFERDNG